MRGRHFVRGGGNFVQGALCPGFGLDVRVWMKLMTLNQLQEIGDVQQKKPVVISFTTEVFKKTQIFQRKNPEKPRYTPRVKKTRFLFISLPKIDRFLKFFHRCTQQKICNNCFKVLCRVKL